MTEFRNRIIAPVGMSGTGKSSVVDHLTSKGIPKIYVGGLVVEAVKQLGLAVNEKNEREYREKMRAEHGNDYFMQQAISQVRNLINAGQHTIVIDGLYTWTEYKLLTHEFPGNELIVIAVVTPRQLRHQRLQHRPIRPLTYEEASQRDYTEIENLEKGGPIAIADYYIINDQDLSHLHHEIDSLLSTCA